MRGKSVERRADEWLDLAESQHGVVSRKQLIAVGMSSARIERLVAADRLKRLRRGVYIVAGQKTTIMSQLMGATLLSEKAVASHRAAAFLWRMTETVPPIEITVPTVITTGDLVVHRRDLEKRDMSLRQGIHVTSPHRTLIDLGDVVDDDVVEDALDRSLEMRITSIAWLERELVRVGTRGRKGAAVLRSLLVAADEQPPTWLERKFIRLLEKGQLPPYQREQSVDPYRIDFAWPDVLIGVEVHGAKWHKNRWTRDLERHNYLTSAGWTILHFTWDQIKTDPDVVIGEIVETHRRLRGWLSFGR